VALVRERTITVHSNQKLYKRNNVQIQKLKLVTQFKKKNIRENSNRI